MSQSPPTDEEIRAQIARLVRETSTQRAATALGLTRETTARIAGGLPVRDGTMALAREKLAKR
jgi:hypothetical protein